MGDSLLLLLPGNSHSSRGPARVKPAAIPQEQVCCGILSPPASHDDGASEEVIYWWELSLLEENIYPLAVAQITLPFYLTGDIDGLGGFAVKKYWIIIGETRLRLGLQACGCLSWRRMASTKPNKTQRRHWFGNQDKHGNQDKQGDLKEKGTLPYSIGSAMPN
ncbi:hypothetical protein MRS44_018524 [Fusarium solani]|uniref:uncharacterized protein n=1 Tax=Fusarium solani TaxID=169388 RepID=UPI0032C45F21|nr:hypothetical protein MRS44_018524 [Fusarium solani]